MGMVEWDEIGGGWEKWDMVDWVAGGLKGGLKCGAGLEWRWRRVGWGCCCTLNK